MLETAFVYEGHSVVITLEIVKNEPRYWFSVDGIRIQFASNPASAKRFVTQFIDVCNDAHYKASKQKPLYKSRITC